MGGPKSSSDDSWFSEICINDYDVSEHEIEKLKPVFSFELVREINESVLRVIQKQFESPDIPECYTPGVWAIVPDDWRNEVWEIQKLSSF